MLREFVGKRTLLLLMENLDDLFDGLGDIGQKQLRAYIQNYSFITILATAQSLFDGVRRQDDPFYGFLYPHYLEELTLDEAVNLLRQIAKLEGDRELESFIPTSTGRDRIKAVHHLAGGNHRIYVILSQFLTRKSLDELVEPFMQMLDDLTPYYQARMAWLSQQQRKIIEFLSDRRHAMTVKEIAQRCFITHQTASSQLKDLREKCYVTSQAIGRESFYELREPLMRFCLEVNKQRGEPIRLFVDFLRLWYTRQELQQQLGQSTDAIDNYGVFNDSERPQSAALIHNLPQKEDYLQQRLEPFPPHADLERQYILYALAMEEDEEDPRIAAYWQEYEDCLEKKDYDKALQYAEKLVEIRGQAKDWSAQGRCFNELKRYEEALASFDKAIELDPNDRWDWSQRGSVLNKLERYEVALACFDKAIELDPNDKWVWRERGRTLDNLQRYEEALVSLDKAIALDPNYADAWFSRGWVLDILARNQEALVSCDQAIALGEKSLAVFFNRAIAILGLNRWDEGIAALDNVLGSIKSTEEASAEDTELIIRNLFNSTHDAGVWKTRITTLVQLYDKYQVASALAQGLVRKQSISALMSEVVSDKVVITWRSVWQEIVGDRLEFQISLRLFNAAVRYRETKGDKRVLLELPIEERKLLQEVLSIKEFE